MDCQMAKTAGNAEHRGKGKGVERYKESRRRLGRRCQLGRRQGIGIERHDPNPSQGGGRGVGMVEAEVSARVGQRQRHCSSEVTESTHQRRESGGSMSAERVQIWKWKLGTTSTKWREESERVLLSRPGPTKMRTSLHG